MSFLSKAEDKIDSAVKVIKSPPVPAFSDIAKPTNDVRIHIHCSVVGFKPS